MICSIIFRYLPFLILNVENVIIIRCVFRILFEWVKRYDFFHSVPLKILHFYLVVCPFEKFVETFDNFFWKLKKTDNKRRYVSFVDFCVTFDYSGKTRPILYNLTRLPSYAQNRFFFIIATLYRCFRQIN